ncbi:hypothetical protein Tco_1525638, partial [Tanacetum coccineum]
MATCHHLSGATWRKHCSPPSPVNLRSTAAEPPGPSGGQRRRSKRVVNDVNKTAEPQPDHRNDGGQVPGTDVYSTSYLPPAQSLDSFFRALSNGVIEECSQLRLDLDKCENVVESHLKITVFASFSILFTSNIKADDGFLVGYSINSKAFRVFNTRTRKVEENLHINFLENKPNVAGSGPEWLFDIDSLTKSMNYKPVTEGNQTNGDAVIETNVNAKQAGQEKASDYEYILLPLMLSNS